MAWDYKDWYRRNKTTLSERRKSKYKTDPTYRAAARRRTKEYYDENLKVEVPQDRKIIKDDRGKKYVTIGKLSVLVNRSLSTIRSYHRSGIIPEPDTFDTRGWRLYSKEQVMLIARVLKAFDKRQIKTLKDVKKMIAENWG